MRFRLDPRDAERLPPPQPAAPVAPTAPAPAARPPPPGAAPTAARAAAAGGALSVRVARALRERKALAIAVVVVVLLGGGATVGAMYALDLGPFAYPNKYLLEEDEIPRGLVNVRLPEEAREEIGIRSNPGELDRERLEDQGMGGPKPDAAWMQLLGTRAGGTPAVVVVPIKYANQEDADSAARSLRTVCAFRDGITALQDGNVVVLLTTADDSSASWLPAVASALKDKNADLRTVCT